MEYLHLNLEPSIRRAERKGILAILKLECRDNRTLTMP